MVPSHVVACLLDQNVQSIAPHFLRTPKHCEGVRAGLRNRFPIFRWPFRAAYFRLLESLLDKNVHSIAPSMIPSKVVACSLDQIVQSIAPHFRAGLRNRFPIFRWPFRAAYFRLLKSLLDQIVQSIAPHFRAGIRNRFPIFLLAL
jgi:hypothetical protein